MTVRELSSMGTLTVRQQRGIDCVFCGVTLAAGNVIDLGPQTFRRCGEPACWFPRACKKHGTEAVTS